MEDEELQNGLKHLKGIEEDLEELKERTTSPKRLFFNGILHGAGAILGSVIALAVLGVVLSFLGIIPEFDEFELYLKSLVDEAREP